MLNGHEISLQLNELKKERLNVMPEDSEALEKIWKKEIKILTQDKEATYDFISNHALMDDLENITEIIEDLCEKINERKLIDLIYEAEEKLHENFKMIIRNYGEPLIKE